MSFKNWKIWLKSKPFVLKWFIILVLIRPIIDNLYFLKNISPFLSPLYIVGVLTPVLALIGISSTPKTEQTNVDKFFKIWSFFIGLGTLFVILFEPFSTLSLEYLLKLTLPLYIYFFVRKLIKNKVDLDGLLTTFLYSGLIVATILIYELTFGPIRVVESRGFDRIQGSFGDVVSYGIYLSFCFLIITYFYFSRKNELPDIKRLRSVVIVGLLCIITLVNIHHVASYSIFAWIFMLFMVFNFKTNKGAAFILAILVFGVFYLFGQPIIEEKVAPLLETDIAVYEGEKGSEKLLHGRMGRWTMMINLLMDENIFAQFLGYPLTMNYSYHFVGVGSHNDYIRILFLSGYLGLYSYLLLIFSVYKSSQKFNNAIKFLVYGTLSILCLYSISIVPTYYPPFMYVVMSIFAFVALPKSAFQNQNN